MLGDKAVQLIKDLTRNKNDCLPNYNQDLVSTVFNEMIELFEANKSDVESLQESSDQHKIACVHVRHEAMLWDKRCLLAYHHQRLMSLKKLRWEFGNVLPDDIVQNLSEAESTWFKSYCSNLQRFMSGLNDGRGLDLTLYKKPPKRLFVQVRCVTDFGDYELDDGTTVVLTKDSVHYLPLNQCEKLIHQAVLEQVK
ncbi:DNA replication complex GINS protein PSF1 [Halotydeus destructor]|nr:DNA replication complex GINS protein PSF1 [Halotydeus destructor]